MADDRPRLRDCGALMDRALAAADSLASAGCCARPAWVAAALLVAASHAADYESARSCLRAAARRLRAAELLAERLAGAAAA